MWDWLKNLMPNSGAKPGSRDFALRQLFNSWEAYRLARRDRPRESYQPHGYSGDTAVISSRDLMGRRTRDLARNTAQAKRIRNMLVDLIVGTGVQTFAWPFAPAELYQLVTEIESLGAGDFGPRLTYALESDDLFEQWFNDPKQFDVEGRLAGPDVCRMLMGDSVLVGTGLLVRTFVKDYKTVPLAYQLMEAEQLDESKDRPASPGKNKIIGGREIDGRNRVVAYHLYLDHPHEFFATGQSSLMGAGAPLSMGSRQVVIPADRIIDLTLFDRPSASGAVSWLDAVGQTIWDRDSYVGDEIRSAAIDAVFAVAVFLNDAQKYGALGFDDGLDDNDENGNRQYKVGHSPAAAVLEKDEKFEMIRQTRPNKDAPSFLELLDRDIAAGSRLSYYSVTGDYKSTSFSSARAAKLDEDLGIAPLQNWFARTVSVPIRVEFNLLAAAAGLLRSVSPAEFRRNAAIYQRFDAIGNGRDLLDPYKEGEARTTRLRTCISTFKEECARRGKHWIRVLIQKKVEEKVADLLGVTLDFSKGGGSSSMATGGTTDDSDGKVSDEQADEIADRVADRLESILRK